MSKREQIQNEALEIAKKYTRCGLAISMGVGKTYIGIKHMDWYLKNVNPDAKFLVVAPKKSIFNSWFDDMNKFGMSYLLDRVTITTYLSLQKQSLAYDVLYLDECHSLLYSHELWLNSFGNKIIGLTGTPPRYKDSEKGKMVSKFCPILYTYITDDAVEDQILNDYRITVHPVNLSRLSVYTVKTKTKTWTTSEYNNYQYQCKALMGATNPKSEMYFRIMRMRGLMEYPSKESYAKKLADTIKGKCIIFCNTQDQADRMCEHSYHSGNPNSEDNLELFKNGSITRLSCVLQLNEGINIPDLDSAILLHSYGNERKAAQRIGRVLRLTPDKVADVHILMYHETIDKKWVEKALEDFDSEKITYKNVHNN
jgi:superfamily II DNA or RNA helicase